MPDVVHHSRHRDRERTLTGTTSASMTLPTFIVGGAQKAGTSWLSRNLAKHPQVFMAPGEIDFFDSEANFARGVAWYAEHFSNAGAATAIGEKSPGYLSMFRSNGPQGQTAQRIRALIPDVKLIFVLRDPVNRAISAARHHMFRRRIPPSASLNDVFFGRHRDFTRIWGVLTGGLYAANLQPYFDAFDWKQIRVWILEEDIAKRPDRMLQDLYCFLDLPPHHDSMMASRKFNQGLKTRACLTVNYYMPQLSVVWQCVDRTMGRFVRAKNEEDVRMGLHEYYRSDKEALFRMLGRRVGAWERDDVSAPGRDMRRR